MHMDSRSSLVIAGVIAALALAVPALAATGGERGPTSTTTSPATGSESGGTLANPPPEVEGSGGVAGPAVEDGARSAQDQPDEEPPQVEQPEEEEPPAETTPETTPDEVAPEEDAEQAPGEGGGQLPAGGSGSGGGLPSTGLEIGALVALGLGLVLAGLALRRRPT